MKTITLTGDYITVEALTRWIRAAYVVVGEFDRAIGDGIERILKVIECQK